MTLGNGHAKTTVFSHIGSAVGLHKVGTSGERRLGEEDGLIDRGCGVALEELFVEVLLDVGDKPLLGGGGAEGWAKRLLAEGRLVHPAKLWRGGEEGVRVWQQRA